MTQNNDQITPKGWQVTLLTLFPEMFPGPLGHSIAGKAKAKGLWDYKTVDIRNYADNKHNQVDDAPFGGGTGMVLRPDVVGAAIDATIPEGTTLIYPSPRGKLFDQNYAKKLSQTSNVAILCGRFEGIDQRILDAYPIEEVSVGDYILSGGEIAALTIMDSCIRLLPGVISKKEALNEESFGENAEYTGLLEYPLYTRPSLWKKRDVPAVLQSGNHKEINAWRLKEAQEITKKRRPDMWQSYASDSGVKDYD